MTGHQLHFLTVLQFCEIRFLARFFLIDCVLNKGHKRFHFHSPQFWLSGLER